MVPNSSGCFLFHAFLRTLFTNVFTDDLRVIGQGVSQLQAMKAMIYMLSLDPTSGTYAASTKFCNDVNASGTQTAAPTCSRSSNGSRRARRRTFNGWGSRRRWTIRKHSLARGKSQ